MGKGKREQELNIIKKAGIHIVLALHAFTVIVEGVLLGRIIDALYKGNEALLWQQLAAMLVAIGIGMASALLAWKMIFYLTKVKIKNIRTSIFRFDLKSSSKFEIADYTTNADLIYSKVLLADWNIFSCIYSMVFALLAMSSINLLLLFVGISVSLLPLLVPKLAGKSMQKKMQEYTAESQEYQNYVLERLKGKNEIRQYQVSDVCQQEYEKMAECLEEKQQRVKEMSNFAKVLSGTFASCSFFIIIAVGGFLTVKGFMTAGGIITIIELLNYTVDPLVAVSDLWKEKNACKSILEKLEQKMTEQEEGGSVKAAIADKPQEIRLREVTFSYDNGKKIFDHFSYRFESGKKYLIRGESGAGKTTLSKLIAGELKPDSGSVEIGGKNIETYQEPVYNQVRKVNQEVCLFSMSIGDNIRFYRNVGEEEINAVLKDMNLSYLSPLAEFDENLSGGEQARISLARAFIQKPGIIIYDEPTAALDEKNTKELMKKITEQECTVVCISHETSSQVEQFFDEVLIL